MKAGDIFYSVMQKDNCPFEQPRITKFVVERIDNTHSCPIVSTKKDKLGRHYVFNESQIYLKYEDAIPEKQKIQEKIKQWEIERKEQDRLYFEEQERKEKQRQLEHDNQIRKKVVQEIREFLENHKYKVFGDYNNQTLQINETYICELTEINEFLNLIEKVEG